MRLLIITLLTLCGTAHAVTVQGLLDALNAKTGVVLSAWIEVTPAVMPRSNLYLGTIAWVEIADGAVTKQSKDIIIKDLGDVVEGVNIEQAYWVGSIPTPLREVPDAYITGRTGTAQAPRVPFTRAEVEAFCNAQWRAQQGNSAARDIVEFDVRNVTPNTVEVRGLFHDVPTNNRLRLVYLISLVDANGATSGANVKFERVVESVE